MCLGRILLILFLLFSASSYAQETKTRTRVKKSKHRMFAPIAIGASYMLWNEDLTISQGASKTKGFANYGGYGFGIEKSWMRGRWLHGGTLMYAFGKATSGGFDSSPTFADGVNRAWWAVQPTYYGYYRFNTTFMLGLGLFGRYRVADWTPMNPALTVDSGSKVQVSAQLLLRWRINSRLTFIQAYTPINFKNSMWTWTAQVDL